MLYSLILNLIETYSFLNVFKYLTVRTGLAVFTSLLVVFLIGNPFINFFSSKKILNPIRDDGPDDHIIKKIIPTVAIIICEKILNLKEIPVEFLYLIFL